MKKTISFLTSLALCLMPLAGTVSNTVAADDKAVISAENGENLSEMDIVFDDELIIAEGETKDFRYTVTGTDKVFFKYNKSSNPGFTLNNRFEGGKGVLTITSNWNSGKNYFVCWLGEDESSIHKNFEFKVVFTCPDCGRVIENEDDIVHGPMRSVCKDCYNDHGFIAPPTSGTITTETTAVFDEKGDANCDDEVNMADAVFIMQCIANPDKYKLTEQGQKNADVDGSGDVTNMDALTIQQFKLKLIDSLT